MANKNMRYHLIFFIIIFLDLISLYGKSLTIGEKRTTIASKQMVRIGVILDLDSPIGKMARSYMSMALSEFYARNANYRTKLTLSVKNSSEDVVAAASAALELMNNEEVQAIIGPQNSNQAKFVINLGEKAQIPIISFSATSPSLSQTQSRFFIRTGLDDSSQVKAITSIVKAYGWREVVLIYEDTEYGNGLIPYITDAFEQIDTRVPYRSVMSPSSSPYQILKELTKLMGMETRVFLVHMAAYLGSKVFVHAKEAGMMSKGYAWITTAGLSTLLHPKIEEAKVTGSMEGVLGVRPYLPTSKDLEDFKLRWKERKLPNIGKTMQSTSEINLFGLWAYDTIWALAKAVELVGLEVNYSSDVLKHKTNSKNTDEMFGITVSKAGPRLLQALLRTSFQGLSGKFQLINGHLQPAAYEIINVVRKNETVIRFCCPPNKEAFHDLVQISNASEPIWPGNTSTPPKGWVIPVTGKTLRIGVPVTSFEDFVNVDWSRHTNEPMISGFSIDIFLEVLKRMPFAVLYEFIPYMNSSTKEAAGTYDDLLYQIKLKKFDAVVGDTTIIGNRTSYVDFTLPYSESGVWMVVKVKDNERKNIWIFLKPLSWDLWLTSTGAFIFTGVVVWILEHRINTEFGDGSRKQQLATTLWFSFSTLVFAHKEKVVSNWTRFVLIIWIFVVLILTQSYTASLASLLTVDKLQPAVVDVNALRQTGAFVGYHKNSFVKELLISQLQFEEKKLKPYSSPEEFHQALSKESKNGGVDAIFDESPYLKNFLANYCSRYIVVGPTYRIDGFGFAFPLGSPLVAHISRAILNVTQNYKIMDAMQHQYFPYETKCQDPSSPFPLDNPSLNVYSFGGLFIITGVISIFSCLIYMVHFLYNHWPALSSFHPEASVLSTITKHFIFDRKDSSVLAIEQTNQATHVNSVSVTEARGDDASAYDRNNLLSHAVSFDQGISDNVALDEEDDEMHSMDSGRFIYGCA
ncbi:glutamate receptor 2.1-like [Prunus avium]|uniref:Glutamate receptor n=1 Tax=Prunus avium TaxID=42229 RepID=A0A6P5U099_PRUAV|nr:glutamate receptor 2.1-like [Prunus avium]